MNTLIFGVLSALLKQNENTDAEKHVICQSLRQIQESVYCYFTTENQEYLNHYWQKQVKQKDNFKNRISQITNDALNEVLDEIQNGKFISYHPIQTKGELISQVIMRKLPDNTDLLFNYNSEKVKEVQQYLKRIHQQQRQHRQKYETIKLKNKQRKIQLSMKQQQMLKKIQQEKRQKLKVQSLKKIEELRKSQQQRKNQHQRFKVFYKEYKSSKPMHVLMQQEYKQKILLPEIEERNKKLSVKKPTPKPTLQEINQHEQQYLQNKKKRPQKLILNQTLDVSYKSQFYLDEQSKFFGDLENQTETIYDIYEKKKRYSQFVKQNYKPRLKPSDQKSEEQQKQQISKVQGHQHIQVPDRSRHIELGNNYLQYVKSLEKKRNLYSSEQNSNSQQIVINKNSRYINYLEEMKKMHSLHKGAGLDWEKYLKDNTASAIQKQSAILIKSKQLQQLAIRKQQRLNVYDRSNAKEVLQQKNEIDDTLIDSIKAKMAIIKGTNQ